VIADQVQSTRHTRHLGPITGKVGLRRQPGGLGRCHTTLTLVPTIPKTSVLSLRGLGPGA
jgi:hypothetical protein